MSTLLTPTSKAAEATGVVLPEEARRSVALVFSISVEGRALGSELAGER